MSVPPELPPSRLGWPFIVILLAPLLVMAVSFAFTNNSDMAGVLLTFAGLVTFGCSIAAATMLARRIGQTTSARVGWGIVMFLAVQAFYGVCFFVGCTAAVMMS